MNYKILFNIPNEKFPTEVTVTEEQMEKIAPALGSKQVVKINGQWYNTAYFAKTVADTEMNQLETSTLPKLEETTQTTSAKNNRQAINEMKEELFKKRIIKNESEETTDNGEPDYYIDSNGEKMYS